MRPLDPRLRPHLAPARRPLAGVLVAGGGRPACWSIAQAFAVTGLVVAVLGAATGAGAWALAVVAVLGRAAPATGWVGDVAAPRGPPPGSARTCGAGWSDAVLAGAAPATGAARRGARAAGHPGRRAPPSRT